MDNEIYLLSSEFTKDEIGSYSDNPDPTKVLCDVDSVTLNETMIAGQNGLKAEYRFTVNRAEYNGEQYLTYLGKLYYIYRTYTPKDSDYIELYAAERAGIT